MRWREE